MTPTLIKLALGLTVAGSLSRASAAGATVPLPKEAESSRSDPVVSGDGGDTRVTASLILLEEGPNYLKLDFILRGPQASTPKTVRISFYSSIANAGFDEHTKLSFLVDARVVNLSHVKHNLVLPSNHSFDAEVPLAVFRRIVSAYAVEGAVGPVNFKLSAAQLKSLKLMADHVPLPAAPAA